MNTINENMSVAEVVESCPNAATSYGQSLAAFLTQLHIRRAVIFRPDATFRGVCWPVARIFK
jgi:hypothetical protein